MDVIGTLNKYPELKIALSLDFDFSVRDAVGLGSHYFPAKVATFFMNHATFNSWYKINFSSLMRFLAEPLFKDAITAEKRLALEQYPKNFGGPALLYVRLYPEPCEVEY